MTRRRERLALSAVISVMVSPVLNFCHCFIVRLIDRRLSQVAPVHRTDALIKIQAARVK
jgi:hypothetical protein